MVGKVKAEVKLLCELLMHNPDSMGVKITDYNSPESKKLQFEASQYRDKGGLYQPASHFEGALITAGSAEKYKGAKKYGFLLKGGIRVFPEHVLYAKTVKPEPFGCWAVVENGRKKSRIWRVRALIPAGSKLSFEIEVFNNEINFESLKKCLEYAGGFIGIGDWRPKYGRFEVIKFVQE